MVLNYTLLAMKIDKLLIKTRFGCSLARSIDGVISILMSAIMWYQAKTLFFLIRNSHNYFFKNKKTHFKL